jgi:hypothetical protein
MTESQLFHFLAFELVTAQKSRKVEKFLYNLPMHGSTFVDGFSTAGILKKYSADYALSPPPFLSVWCLVDFQTASSSNPSNQELWFYWRREPVGYGYPLLSSTSNTTFMILPLL